MILVLSIVSHKLKTKREKNNKELTKLVISKESSCVVYHREGDDAAERFGRILCNTDVKTPGLASTACTHRK